MTYTCRAMYCILLVRVCFYFAGALYVELYVHVHFIFNVIHLNFVGCLLTELQNLKLMNKSDRDCVHYL